MFEFLKKIFTNRISDEEFDKLVDESQAIPCPNCGCYLSKEIWDDEDKCPQCKQPLGSVSKD